MALLFATISTSVALADNPVEPLLLKLPAGVIVERSVEVPAPTTVAIGKKLGGQIQRLNNSVVRVHGRPIGVNVIFAVDEVNGRAIQASLEKIKPYPFCLRKGAVVIEYVGQNIDADFATKTSYELGLLDKPKAVRYRVTADLANIDQADYMACNLLFNQFVALQNGASQESAAQINELAKRFGFGRTLILRNPVLSNPSAKLTFRPQAAGAQDGGATISYRFEEPERRQGVPFVSAMLEVSVDETGFLPTAVQPAEHLTAATPFWPADDPTVLALARQITAGKSTNDDKVMAILEWLSPGKNVKYSGETGTRWGTRKVFEQRFGHCWDFSDCFVTLARASGVPSRQVAGWLYGSSGHVWAEFYREGKGWQQVDPTGGGTLACGIYHIPYFTSEDGEMPIVYVSMPKVEILEAK